MQSIYDRWTGRRARQTRLTRHAERARKALRVSALESLESRVVPAVNMTVTITATHSIQFTEGVEDNNLTVNYNPATNTYQFTDANAGVGSSFTIVDNSGNPTDVNTFIPNGIQITSNSLYPNLSIDQGLGTNAVAVNGENSATTINNKSQTVVLGTTSLDTLLATVGVTGATSLTLNDQSFGGAATYTVTGSAVSRNAGSFAGLTYSNIGTLTLNKGLTPSTVNVDGNTATTTNINLQGSGNVVNVGNGNLFAFSFGVVNVAGGTNTTLNVNDQADNDINTFNLSAGQVSAPGILPPIVVNYDVGVTSLKLNGGTTNAGGVTYWVLGTQAGTETSIAAGNKNDTINVLANSSTLNVDGGPGMNSVNIGNAGSLAGIHGVVNVVDTGGLTNLTVSALNDVAGTTATDKLNTGTGLAELKGLTPPDGQINYAPGIIQTLNVANVTGKTNKFTLDFSNGNVLPSANANSLLNYDGGAALNPAITPGEFNLVGTLPPGGFTNETHNVTGESTGAITLQAPAVGFAYRINYTGVPAHTINDVAPAAFYSFTDLSTPGLVVLNQGPVFAGFQTLGIRSFDTPPSFVDTNIANKINVSINLPGGAAPDASQKFILAYFLPAPVPGLTTLAINQNTDGDTQILSAPSGVAVTVTQTNGEFTSEVSGTGLKPGTTTVLKGSSGNNNSLTYDAGGVAAINVINVGTFFSPAQSSSSLGPDTTLFGNSFGAGNLKYSDYLHVTVNNIAPVTPFTFTSSQSAVEGQPLINIKVGEFLSYAIGSQANDFQATINWGDGTSSQGTIVRDALDHSLYGVYGTHTYKSTVLPSQPTFSVYTTGSTGDLLINGIPTTFHTNALNVAGPVQPFDVAISSNGIQLTANPVSAIEGNSTGTIPLGTFIDFGGADDLNLYSASISWGDGTTTSGVITQNGTSNTYTITGGPHTYQEAGVYTITLKLTDSEGSPAQTVTATTIAYVQDATLTPVASPALTATEGTSFTGQVASFTDANPLGTVSDFTAVIYWGDGSTSLGVVSQPGGINTPFIVTGTHTYLEETTGKPAYKVGTVITDGDGAKTDTASTPTLVTVNDAQLTAQPGVNLKGVEGLQLVNVRVGTFTDANPFGSVDDFTATIDWGDGTPVGTGVVQLIGGTPGGPLFQVIGTHTYAEAGTKTITVTVTDIGGAAPITITSTASIVDAALSSAGTFIQGLDGQPTGSVLLATFTDANPLALLSDFTASVQWGDGSSNSGLSIVPVGGPNGVTYQVFGSHTYTTHGSYQVTTTITDVDGAVTLAHGEADIADSPLSGATGIAVIGVEGKKLSNVALGTFLDANPGAPASDFSGTIDWGDGTLSLAKFTFVTLVNNQAQFRVSGTHTYTEEGSYAIHVDIYDEGQVKTAIDTTATIADAPLTAVAGLAVVAQEGLAFSNVPVATFTDTNPLGTVSDFVATIDWGDGTALDTSVITQVGGNATGVIFRVLGSHTYAEEGTYPISVVITDVGGSTATASAANSNGASAKVNDAPLTGVGASVQGVEGLGLSQTGGATFGPVLLGTFTDADLGSTIADFTTPPGSVVVNWGDGSAPETLTASHLARSGSANGILYSINAAHNYTEEGSFQIVVTVTDTGGATTVIHSEADVSDATLFQSAAQPFVHTVESPIFPVPVFGGPIFSGNVGAFVDTNPGGTVDDFKATIDWGDGTPLSFGTISQPGGPGTDLIVSGSHTYADSGVTTGNGTFGTYPITIHVTDVGGSKLTVTNTARVDDRSIALAGKLNPKSDSGVSNSDAITNVQQPWFFGTSEPRSNVVLWAQPSGGAAFPIGQAAAQSDGSWNIRSNVALTDGIYTITATATDQFGKTNVTTTTPVVITPKLVIDTKGPQVTSVFFDRLNGQIDVSYFDGLSGLVDTTLVDAANYSFSKVHIAKQKGVPYLINHVSLFPGGNANSELAVLTVNSGQPIRGGFYDFIIHSASPVMTSGVQDVAGNALDGEFYGYFPSGNKVPGGDFHARLDAVHNIIFSPTTVIGNSTPNVPPGTVQPPVFIKTVVPGKAVPHGPVLQASKSVGVKAKAINVLSSVKHGF